MSGIRNSASRSRGRCHRPPAAHAAVKEEASTHKVIAVNIHGRFRGQDMQIGSLSVLIVNVLQCFLKGPFPELVVDEYHHHEEFRGEQVTEVDVQAGDARRRHDVPHNH